MKKEVNLADRRAAFELLKQLYTIEDDDGDTTRTSDDNDTIREIRAAGSRQVAELPPDS